MAQPRVVAWEKLALASSLEPHSGARVPMLAVSWVVLLAAYWVDQMAALWAGQLAGLTGAWVCGLADL